MFTSGRLDFSSVIPYKEKLNVNVIFILSRYININYKKHELLRLLADWADGFIWPPKHWKTARK